MPLRLDKRTHVPWVWELLAPLLAVLLSVLAGAGLFAMLGLAPWATVAAFLLQPVADGYGLAELLLKMTPLMLCAGGLVFCFRAGVWNIGAEGQFLLGALSGGAVALAGGDDGSRWWLPLALLAGVVGGSAWAALAAWLKASFRANEILTTIMLNYVALNLLEYLVHGPLRDPGGFSFPESALFADHVLLPLLFEEYRVTVAAPAAVLVLLFSWVLLSRSVFAYRLAVAGAGERPARFAGVSRARYTWWVLLLSGALAGLAGVAEVTGPVGQLTPYLGVGYGYAAIIVAFLGRLHPLGVFFASALMALTYLGGENLQIEAGVPKAVALLFQGLLLFFLLACDAAKRYRLRWRTAPAPAVS